MCNDKDGTELTNRDSNTSKSGSRKGSQVEESKSQSSVSDDKKTNKQVIKDMIFHREVSMSSSEHTDSEAEADIDNYERSEGINNQVNNESEVNASSQLSERKERDGKFEDGKPVIASSAGGVQVRERAASAPARIESEGEDKPDEMNNYTGQFADSQTSGKSSLNINKSSSSRVNTSTDQVKDITESRTIADSAGGDQVRERADSAPMKVQAGSSNNQSSIESDEDGQARKRAASAPAEAQARSSNNQSSAVAVEAGVQADIPSSLEQQLNQQEAGVPATIPNSLEQELGQHIASIGESWKRSLTLLYINIIKEFIQSVVQCCNDIIALDQESKSQNTSANKATIQLALQTISGNCSLRSRIYDLKGTKQTNAPEAQQVQASIASDESGKQTPIATIAYLSLDNLVDWNLLIPSQHYPNPSKTPLVNDLPPKTDLFQGWNDNQITQFPNVFWIVYTRDTSDTEQKPMTFSAFAKKRKPLEELIILKPSDSVSEQETGNNPISNPPSESEKTDQPDQTVTGLSGDQPTSNELQQLFLFANSQTAMVAAGEMLVNMYSLQLQVQLEKEMIKSNQLTDWIVPVLTSATEAAFNILVKRYGYFVGDLVPNIIKTQLLLSKAIQGEVNLQQVAIAQSDYEFDLQSRGFLRNKPSASSLTQKIKKIQESIDGLRSNLTGADEKKNKKIKSEIEKKEIHIEKLDKERTILLKNKETKRDQVSQGN